MSEPSDALRELAAQGRQFYAQYLAVQKAKHSAPANAAMGTDILSFFLDLSGYKRALGRIGKGLAYSSVATKETDIRAAYDTWNKSVRSSLLGISVVRKQVPREPNSTNLVRRFAKSQEFARLDTRLEHGVRFLESLADQRLMRNEDLPAIRPSPRRPKVAKAPEHGGPQSAISVDGSKVVQLLESFPSEQRAIEGALGVYARKTPDYGRQALNSCRNAIENLTKVLSGEGDWNVGLTKVLTGDDQRQIIRKVHVFLSASGTHGGKEPDDSTVEMGMSLTFVALMLLLKKRPT